MQTAGDHQMDDDEEPAVHLEHDAFAEPLDADDALPDQVVEWRLDGAKEEWRFEAHFL
jgi:hypothetical protein